MYIQYWRFTDLRLPSLSNEQKTWFSGARFKIGQDPEKPNFKGILRKGSSINLKDVRTRGEGVCQNRTPSNGGRGVKATAECRRPQNLKKLSN